MPARALPAHARRCAQRRRLVPMRRWGGREAKRWEGEPTVGGELAGVAQCVRMRPGGGKAVMPARVLWPLELHGGRVDL
jgi:hypothetical protein